MAERRPLVVSSGAKVELPTGDTIPQSALSLVRVAGVCFDGGSSDLASGLKQYVSVPQACTITRWRIMAYQSGSAQVDVWKDSWANFPPTDADTITNGNEPAITSAVNGEATDLSGWSSVAVAAGDVLAFYLDSVSGIKKLDIQLWGTPA